MWKRTLYRPVQSLVVVLLAACVLSILGLVQLASRGRARLRLIHSRVEHSKHILEVGLRAQQSLLQHREASREVDPAVVAALRSEVAALAASDLAADPENTARLRRLTEVLDSGTGLSRDGLVQTVAVLNHVLEAETAAQARLWRSIDEDASAERDLVIGIAVVLPLLLLIGCWLGQRWFVKPLDDLRVLLNQLASGERRQVDGDGIHPVLEPLFHNYNELVARLDELEEEHTSHARMLEDRIREATATLLEQQATLARAERLAVMGETAACLAHELRNPLAGILMSLGNLRAEADDADTVERLSIVVHELERLTRLLNDALSSARHVPEALRDVQLHRMVDELLNLVRYQVPDHVRFENTITEPLVCTLPTDRVRQALLNLVINSVHALGEHPGVVAVSASRDGDRLVLVVEDDGPGFPAEILRTGINAFVSRSPWGTGLGLAMVQRLATDLGGAVHLANREPAGARVRLELPCSHG